MIYVPDLENYKCFVVQSEGVIRAYENVPEYNTSSNYRDYYINSSYIYKDGTQNFGNSSYYGLPVCLDNTKLTNAISYRLDFDKILICFVIIVGIFYFITSKIIRSLFFGGKYSWKSC